MFGFFKRKKQPAPAPAEEVRVMAPGTQIHYNPDLVAQLQKDHQELLALYGKIKERFDQGDYKGVTQLLNVFRQALQGHLLTENIRLYIYLERSMDHDELNGDLVRGFRREMDGIAKVAMAFLKKYEMIGVDAELAKPFAAEFANLGQVLIERINREEGILYPLYMPNYC
jgi:hemerythrin-like domain-containing protein